MYLILNQKTTTTSRHWTEINKRISMSFHVDLEGLGLSFYFVQPLCGCFVDTLVGIEIKNDAYGLQTH